MAEDEKSVKMQIEKDLDLRKCADDFSKYCQVDITDETRGLENSIEEMLANLDEFSHLADTIRNDSSQILFMLLPELCAKCQALPTIFNRIDQLEVFLEKVKKCVDDFEEKVDQAEEELGSHSIKKVLSAIPYLNLMQKKQVPPTNPPEKEAPTWQPPELFKTSDFFKKEVHEKSLDSEGITTKLETGFETAEPD